jgi:UDP-N-acetylmuramoyl-L-alanine---L-glutamate ligase
MTDLLHQLMSGKRVLLLGFGREGQSSFALIREALPGLRLAVADRNPEVGGNPLLHRDANVELILGENYLEGLNRFDLIVKTPGIRLSNLSYDVPREKITSQTDLFLRKYAPQVTGVTGTKGKSTTASLIYHILNSAGKDAVLLGNIGTPAFHYTGQISPATRIVFELSSHQLEYITKAPHTALLLNLYQEHLDAYASYEHYQEAKMNIVRNQEEGDFFIYNADDPLVNGHAKGFAGHRALIPFSLRESPGNVTTGQGEEVTIRLPGKDPVHLTGIHNRYLRGEHNLQNIMAAVTAAALAGATAHEIAEGLDSFKGLAHRMEYIGRYHDIDFYNDSIATIPEACMAAIRSIPGVDTLIAGGFDRGIDYSQLAAFLAAGNLRNIILLGAAGRRIGDHFEKNMKHEKNVFYITRFDEFLPIALKYTRPGHVCLLSPAAASYDEFRSFEERGMRFAELVKSDAHLF